MSSTVNELVAVLKGHEYDYIKARLELLKEINKEMGNSLTVEQAFELWSDFIARMGTWHSPEQEANFIKEVTASTAFVAGDLIAYSNRYDTFRELASQLDDFRNGGICYLRNISDGFEKTFEKDLEILLSLVVRYNIVRIRYV